MYKVKLGGEEGNMKNQGDWLILRYRLNLGIINIGYIISDERGVGCGVRSTSSSVIGLFTAEQSTNNKRLR